MAKKFSLSKDMKSVLLFSKSGKYLLSKGPMMVEDLIQKIETGIQAPKEILGDGFDCELLQAGSSGWKKGKLKLSLQFVEDSSDNNEGNDTTAALDELRQAQQEPGWPPQESE